MVLVVAAAAFLVAAVLLLLHHGREDAATSAARQESCPEVCFFQLSDVGNFRTCSHEMWIILFLCLALGCLLW